MYSIAHLAPPKNICAKNNRYTHMNTMCQSCEVSYVASKCIMLWGATNWSRANAHCSEVL